jgi:hypothetical protein
LAISRRHGGASSLTPKGHVWDRRQSLLFVRVDNRDPVEWRRLWSNQRVPPENLSTRFDFSVVLTLLPALIIPAVWAMVWAGADTLMTAYGDKQTLG